MGRQDLVLDQVRPEHEQPIEPGLYVNMSVVFTPSTSQQSIWSNAVVDHVQITVAEDIGAGDRAAYYSKSGALRDMVQNHLAQLLCLTAMEAPASMDADSVRDEKLKVLRSLRPFTPEDLKTNVVRGQYAAGAIEGK